jgi:hypothetical protein
MRADVKTSTFLQGLQNRRREWSSAIVYEGIRYLRWLTVGQGTCGTISEHGYILLR